MFLRQISDFQNNFKFLDRLNDIVFNVWKDNNAESFKTQSMDQLEMFYRNYVNEMRQRSNEMNTLEQEINELLEELQNIGHELRLMAINPEIQGCNLYRAYGKIRHDMSGTEAFVARRDETDEIEMIAYSRCNEVYEIKEIYFGEPL